MPLKLSVLMALLVALGLLIGLPVDADTLPGGAEGCIVGGADASGPTGPLTHAQTCTYTATRTGGYVARGDWSMSVTVGSTTSTYGPSNAPPQGCALWGPGAAITVSIGSSGSSIAAGNPYPAATDPTLTRPC